jgi:hypothetical protein
MRETCRQPLLVIRGPFRWLWLAYVTSSLGDQFHLVALSWVVVQLTGSAASLGGVLTAGALPRALLMVFGGVVSDRAAPVRVLILLHLVRGGLSLTLAWLTAGGLLRMSSLYGIAALFGIAEAFSFPASTALVPLTVDADHVQPANAVLQGSVHVAAFAGPALAGLLLAWSGAAACFSVDAVSFALGAALLLGLPRTPAGRPSNAHASWTRELADGLRYVRSVPALRTLLSLNLVLSLTVSGPLIVGLAVLARARFASHASAFGTSLSAVAGGLLVGSLAAGRWRPRRPVEAFAGLVAGFGAGMASLTWAPTLSAAGLVLVAMGALAGVANVMVVSWIQTSVPSALLGRTMSLLLLTSVGLAPLSYAAAGLLATAGVAWLFLGAGATVLGACAVALVAVSLRRAA